MIGCASRCRLKPDSSEEARRCVSSDGMDPMTLSNRRDTTQSADETLTDTLALMSGCHCQMPDFDLILGRPYRDQCADDLSVDLGRQFKLPTVDIEFAPDIARKAERLP